MIARLWWNKLKYGKAEPAAQDFTDFTLCILSMAGSVFSTTLIYLDVFLVAFIHLFVSSTFFSVTSWCVTNQFKLSSAEILPARRNKIGF